jgi:uncharacterized protein (TIGR01244 family)
MRGNSIERNRDEGADEMNVQREVSPQITVADQPTEADLEALKQAGYVGVINLRHDGEPDQPLSTAAEGEKVRTLGMDYLHQSVGGGPLGEPTVEAVCGFLDERGRGQGKVLVHCRKGSRAAALVLIHRAIRERWSPTEAIAKGRALGLEVDGNLRTMVENYLHDHQGNP